MLNVLLLALAPSATTLPAPAVYTPPPFQDPIENEICWYLYVPNVLREAIYGPHCPPGYYMEPVVWEQCVALVMPGLVDAAAEYEATTTQALTQWRVARSIYKVQYDACQTDECRAAVVAAMCASRKATQDTVDIAVTIFENKTLAARDGFRTCIQDGCASLKDHPCDLSAYDLPKDPLSSAFYRIPQCPNGNDIEKACRDAADDAFGSTRDNHIRDAYKAKVDARFSKYQRDVGQAVEEEGDDCLKLKARLDKLHSDLLRDTKAIGDAFKAAWDAYMAEWLAWIVSQCCGDN